MFILVKDIADKTILSDKCLRRLLTYVLRDTLDIVSVDRWTNRLVVVQANPQSPTLRQAYGVVITLADEVTLENNIIRYIESHVGPNAEQLSIYAKVLRTRGVLASMAQRLEKPDDLVHFYLGRVKLAKPIALKIGKRWPVTNYVYSETAHVDPQEFNNCLMEYFKLTQGAEVE